MTDINWNLEFNNFGNDTNIIAKGTSKTRPSLSVEEVEVPTPTGDKAFIAGVSEWLPFILTVDNSLNEAIYKQIDNQQKYIMLDLNEKLKFKYNFDLTINNMVNTFRLENCSILEYNFFETTTELTIRFDNCLTI